MLIREEWKRSDWRGECKMVIDNKQYSVEVVVYSNIVKYKIVYIDVDNDNTEMT